MAAGCCFVTAATRPLAAKASTPAPVALFRLLLLECECGINQGFLITAEPSVPAAILRVNALSNHLPCRLAKMGRVAQDGFRITHILDLHDRAAGRGELAEPNERIGLQSSLTPQFLHLWRAVDMVDLSIRTLQHQVGATAFLPFWTFIVESDVISTLRAAGRRVYIHIPISGGDMLNDTLLGFQTLAETAAEKSLVVWINEHFGEIERDGKTFDQMQVFLDNREKVLTSIGIPQRSPDLYGSDIRHMRERKLTFEEAISVDLDFNIVEKWRLNRVRRELFEQLVQTPFA
jgi:hypothetical protein